MFGRKATGRLAVGAMVAVAVMMAGVGGSVASADHGSDDHSSHGNGDTFGAWLSEGTCDDLAPSPLTSIGDLEIDDDHDATRDLALTPPAPSPIWTEDEDVNATYASLTSSPHAVVVRTTEDVASDVIACGEIVNVPAGTEPFTVELKTVGDSGYTGVARFSVDRDDKGDEVEIAVGIWEGTSVATPAAGTPAA